MKVVVLPDKFRGTLESREFVDVAKRVLGDFGEVQGRVVSDGGEGLIEALGGSFIDVATVDALGRSIQAGYSRLEDGTAIVEMSRASGMNLVGSAESNDALAASTYGTGVLIRAAVVGGCTKVIVGCGGSATTDGGMGALRALGSDSIYQRVSFTAAVDVNTRYLEAARVFAPQKGASATEVEFLTRRLAGCANLLTERYKRDPSKIDGSGAAGGLAGMIYAMGGSIVPGFDVVEEYLGLEDLIEGCDLVITGEGLVDSESFDGKVVGSVLALAARLKKPTLVVCGTARPEVRSRLAQSALGVVELVAVFGQDKAMTETAWCVGEAMAGFASHYAKGGDWPKAAEINNPGN